MYRNNAVLGVSVLGLCVVSLGQQTSYEELLSIEEVEAVTGIQGIKLVPRNPQMGAGGELNFALADGGMVLMVGVQDAPMYDEWKTEEGFFHESVADLGDEAFQGPSFGFHESVADLGDEAFQGPSFGEHRYILVFRKGGKAIAVTSFFNLEAGAEPFLSQEQLREVAKIIIPRL